jgi:hypothetical protein
MATRRAYSGDIIKKIKPRLDQLQRATGRAITPGQLEAFVAAEMEVEAARSERKHALALQEKAITSNIELGEKRLAMEEEAGKVGALVDIAGAGATYSLAKSYLGGGPEKVGGQKAITGVTSTLSEGGQAAITTAPGIGTETLTGTAADFATESFVPAAGGGTEVAGAGLATPALAGTGAKLLAGTLGANQEVSNVAGGAVAGGLLAAGTSIGGPVGAAVGGILGLSVGEVADSVLCTHLHKTGQLDFEIYRHASFYALEHIPEPVYLGYRVLADPLVKRAKESRFWNQIVRWIGIPMSKELAHRFRPKRFKANYAGKAILFLGMPLCKIVNRLAPDKKLYEMEVL